MSALRPLAAALAALALWGCGSGGAEDAVAEASSRLGSIRAGDLDLRLTIETPEGEPVGFAMRGPFELRGPGRLPVLEVDYTRIAGGREATVTLVSDGREVHAEAGGERLELTTEQAARLRGASAAVGEDGIGSLRLDDWAETAEESAGGRVGGAETRKVTGDLDVVETLDGLAALGFGAPIGDDEAAEELRAATRSATYELFTGAEDGLLRRLDLAIELGREVPEELRASLGDTVGATIRLSLGISNPKT